MGFDGEGWEAVNTALTPVTAWRDHTGTAWSRGRKARLSGIVAKIVARHEDVTRRGGGCLEGWADAIIVTDPSFEDREVAHALVTAARDAGLSGGEFLGWRAAMAAIADGRAYLAGRQA